MSGEITQEQAQLEATQHEQISSIARALATPKTSACAELLKGVVTAYTYPYLTVQIGGDTATSISEVRHWESYSPVVGDTCNMIKQGSDVVAVSRTNGSSVNPLLNGWATPTLATGFAHSPDTIMYRMVNNHGDKMLQLRGSCTMTGSVSYVANVATVFTLPVGFRPLLPSSILIPRDSGGTCVKINFLTSGVVQIDNLKGVRTDSDNAASATSSVDMQHFHAEGNGYPNFATGTAIYGTWNAGAGPYTNGFPGGNPHTHLIPPHDHGMANTLPTSMWFTGTNIIL